MQNILLKIVKLPMFTVINVTKKYIKRINMDILENLKKIYILTIYDKLYKIYSGLSCYNNDLVNYSSKFNFIKIFDHPR